MKSANDPRQRDKFETVTALAEEAEVGRATVYRWMKNPAGLRKRTRKAIEGAVAKKKFKRFKKYCNAN